MSSPASSSSILRALARLRLHGALRIAAFFAGLRALCARYLGTFVRAVLRRVRSRRRALLIGIQSVAEPPAKVIFPAGATIDAGKGAATALYPGLPRAGHKRPKHPRNPATKKKKAAVAASKGGLKGPHHDVEAMRRVLIGACARDWCMEIAHLCLQRSTGTTPMTSSPSSTTVMRRISSRRGKISCVCSFAHHP